MESPIKSSPLPPAWDGSPTWFVPAEQYGRSIDRFPPASGSGGTSIINFIPPLWFSKIDSTHLTIAFGQVSAITPSAGWAGGGNDVGVSVDVSGYADGTYNIYLDATVSATTGAVSAVTVTASTSAVPADSSTHSYRLVGTATIASAVITASSTSSMAYSQDFVACTPGDTTTYHWNVA